MREVLLDGSPSAVGVLAGALRAALDGSGPAVAALPAGSPGLRACIAPESPLEPDVALVVATSGSSGEAKGVLLTASALVASASATHERLGGPGQWLLVLPAEHIAGIQVLVRSELAGRPAVVMGVGEGFRVRAFVEAASDALMADGPVYTAMVPTQLTRVLAAGGDALAALRAFDAVLLGRADDVINTGGLKVAAGAVERVLGSVYGVAEVCVVGLPDPEWGELVAALVVPSFVDDPPRVEDLRTAVRVALGPASVPKLIRLVGALPLRGVGKVDRVAVRAAFA